jgi:uncharacterized membrane protein
MRRMNHLDLQINLLSEQENAHMMRMLQSILQHLQIESDQAVQTLQADAEPEQMVSQIKAENLASSP